MESEEVDRLRADLCEHLARELHDSVAGQLQAMLVEMELLRLRGEAPGELETFQAATRQALGRLRALLYQLRGQPQPADAIGDQVERRLGAVLETRQVGKRRSASAKV